MKQFCKILCASLLVCSCAPAKQSKLTADFSISTFDTLGYKKQAEFINLLDKQSRMKFMSLFLRNRIFDLPPTAYVIFLKNGKFIYDCDSPDGGTITQKYNKFFTGRWAYQDDKIIIDSDDNKITNFGKHEVWDNIWVGKDEAKDNEIILTIHVLERIEHDGKIKKDFENALYNWGVEGNFGQDNTVKQYALKQNEK